ncbi:hypothetical protein, partial [Xenorhabdus cabanillasii]|uniref:hypothetical protein n=1 Tax=Xenorhabdus cabanillasii TaxID=351673 RepID=UPI00056ED2E6
TWNYTLLTEVINGNGIRQQVVIDSAEYQAGHLIHYILWISRCNLERGVYDIFGFLLEKSRVNYLYLPKYKEGN